MQRGRNAHHLSIEAGHLDVAQYLAPKMGDHLRDTDDGNQLGAEGGYVNVAKCLAQNRPRDEVNTALHKAAQNGQLSTVEYLVESCRFDVTLRGKVG